jgi:hypothetical protein
MFKKKYIYEWDNLETTQREDTINRLPERRLWKAVVLNAITDAMSNPSTKYCKMNKLRALSWLLNDDNNFCAVCDFAGLSPREIRNKLKRILDNSEHVTKH